MNLEEIKDSGSERLDEVRAAYGRQEVRHQGGPAPAKRLFSKKALP